MAIEQPTYKVLLAEGSCEIREYAEFYIAETSVSGDLNSASSRAFGRLFNYISGDNQTQEKIAMTSPVQQKQTSDGWAVSFVVPRSVAAAGVPNPNSQNVRIEKVPGGKFAVIRYSGFWGERRFAEKLSELNVWLSKQKLKSVGAAISAVYNPPYMPPFLRRNEVMVRLDSK